MILQLCPNCLSDNVRYFTEVEHDPRDGSSEEHEDCLAMTNSHECKDCEWAGNAFTEVTANMIQDLVTQAMLNRDGCSTANLYLSRPLVPFDEFSGVAE